MAHTPKGIVTLSGPTCIGKSTAITEILTKIKGKRLLSHTTRLRRASDADKEYAYCSREDYWDHLEAGKICWEVSVRGEWYWTLKKTVDDALASEMAHFGALTLENGVDKLLSYARGKGLFKYIVPIYLWSEDWGELTQRMQERGYSRETILLNLSLARKWNPQARSFTPANLHFINVTGKSIQDVQAEILEHLGSVLPL